MRIWPAILLVLALLPMVRLIRPGRPRPARPGHRLRRLAIGALWRFGLPVPVLLLAAGRLRALAVMPPEFRPLAAWLDLSGGGDIVLVGALVVGTLIGMALAAAMTAWRAWRRRPARRWFGDFAHLEATAAADRGWAAALSLVAGVTEEGYFRLLLPLLAAMAWPGFGPGYGSGFAPGLGAVAGFAGSTLLFGAAHRYQGWRGVATTTVVGALFAALYLMSGSLALAMAYHALVDLGSLVVRPWLRQAVERRVGVRA